MSKSQKFKKFVNMLAFIGIVAIAVVLLLNLIFGALNIFDSEVVVAMDLLAQCIAYLVTAIYAFYFVYSKNKPVYTIVYVIAVILIVVLLII